MFINDEYTKWLEEKLMYSLCPKKGAELADNTKTAFRQIIRHNYINRNDSNFGDTYSIKRDLKKWYDGEITASTLSLR